MAKTVGIQFRGKGKTYTFLVGELLIKQGDSVIVETAQGMECGTVVNDITELIEDNIGSPLKMVLRKATDDDLRKVGENARKEKEAFEICEKKVLEHKLDMKLVEAQCTFDRSKLIFFFTSDGRVDFRDLVKDLASVFHTRIELRQIGVRDEARSVGGLGICGRPFCCAEFLDDFQPVSIKMAKEQGLSLNPTKISGTCGRLMCCLKYEQDAYEDLIRNTAPQGAYVKTPDGNGFVIESHLLTGILKVKLESEDGNTRIYKNADVIVLKKGERNIDKRRDKPEKQAVTAEPTEQAVEAGEFINEAEPKTIHPKQPPRQPQPRKATDHQKVPRIVDAMLSAPSDSTGKPAHEIMAPDGNSNNSGNSNNRNRNRNRRFNNKNRYKGNRQKQNNAVPKKSGESKR